MKLERVYKDSPLFSFLPVLCVSCTWSGRKLEFGWGRWIYVIKWDKRFTNFAHYHLIIEAMQFTGGFSYDEMTVEWGERFTNVAHYHPKMNCIDIDTLEGNDVANIGDWIIKGISVKGEFYSCKPDIFEKTYGV